MIRTKYTRLTTLAGKTIITRYTFSPARKKGSHRAPHSNPTPEAMAKINRKNQEYRLTADMNANFEDGDYHLVLQYDDASDLTLEDAQSALKNFKRKLRRFCGKNNLLFKCIDTIGCGKINGHLHHHMLLSHDIPVEVIAAAWTYGIVDLKRLDSNGNYSALAAYFLKNSDETKSLRQKNSKAYSTSRAIVHPEIRKERLSRTPFDILDVETLSPRKGYYIDQDSVRSFDHPITGCPCLEYIEVSLVDNSRLKYYHRGVPAKREPIYRIDDHSSNTADRSLVSQQEHGPAIIAASATPNPQKTVPLPPVDTPTHGGDYIVDALDSYKWHQIVETVHSNWVGRVLSSGEATSGTSTDRELHEADHIPSK